VFWISNYNIKILNLHLFVVSYLSHYLNKKNWIKTILKWFDNL
jgi:hypothetical protein